MGKITETAARIYSDFQQDQDTWRFTMRVVRYAYKLRYESRVFEFIHEISRLMGRPIQYWHDLPMENQA